MNSLSIWKSKAFLGSIGLALLLSLFSTKANAAAWTIATSETWSAFLTANPTYANTDNITVNGGITFTIDVANAQTAAITLGSANNTTGTLAFNANSQLTVTGTTTVGVTTGTARNGAIDMTNGGTLITTGFVVNGTGTLTAGAGTIQLNATAAIGLPATTVSTTWGTFNNLVINSSAAVTLGQATTINHNLTITSGTLSTSANNYAVNVGGNFSNSGTFTGNTSTVTMNGTAAQSIGGTSSTTFSTLVISNTSATVSTTANITATTTTVNTNATLSVGSGNTLTGTTLTDNGTIVANGGTFQTQYNFTSRTLTNVTTAGSVAFNASTTMSGTLTVGSGCTVTPTAAAVLTMGTLTGSGTIAVTHTGTSSGDLIPQYSATTRTMTNLTVNMSGTAAQFIGTSPLNNLTINNASGVTLASAVTLTGALILTNGQINLGANNLTAASITGGSSSSYVNISGAGLLIEPVAGSATVFPIGISGSYTPITLTGTASSVNYSVGVSTTVNDFKGIASSSNDINRTWFIAPASNATSVTVGLQWNATNENSGFTRSSMSIAYRNSLTTGNWNSLISGAASGSDPYTISTSLNNPTSGNTYYFGGFNTNASALPVELVKFTVQKNDNNALLNWTTASEFNNRGFYIESSANGTSWQVQGFVAGAGNSQKIRNYSYTSPLNNVNGIIYYRLHQVDFNGKDDYSPIRSLTVNNGVQMTASVYPNPATSVINVSLSNLENNSMIRVTNLNGNVLMQMPVNYEGGNSTIPVNISSLVKGTYFIQIVSPAETVSKTFIKF
jgi:hypothetical protein